MGYDRAWQPVWHALEDADDETVYVMTEDDRLVELASQEHVAAFVEALDERGIRERALKAGLKAHAQAAPPPTVSAPKWEQVRALPHSSCSCHSGSYLILSNFLCPLLVVSMDKARMLTNIYEFQKRWI